MASDLTRISVSAQQASTEFELLQVVLQETAYPWTPDDIDHHHPLQAMESSWEDELTEEERGAIAAHGQQFFHTLNALWGDTPETTTIASNHTVTASLNTLQATLAKTFSDRVPTTLLQQLTQKAHTLAQQPLTLADQLVQCVQEILPEWGQDDLHVLARPYAFAMRGPSSDKLDKAVTAVRSVAWDELSGVEQARLSLAIANYTLGQITKESDPNS
ncbi:MAG: hypothetical protein F6K09_01915 [Merismopedia sp. SIO2A8]|nr:hypothetical protein [Merismopedia sp. SIO2A8]